MHHNEFDDVTNQICSKFSKEEAAYYYLNTNTRWPSGRLYNHYKNCVSKLRKRNLFPREKSAKMKRVGFDQLDKPSETRRKNITIIG